MTEGFKEIIDALEKALPTMNDDDEEYFIDLMQRYFRIFVGYDIDSEDKSPICCVVGYTRELNEGGCAGPIFELNSLKEALFDLQLDAKSDVIMGNPQYLDKSIEVLDEMVVFLKKLRSGECEELTF